MKNCPFLVLMVLFLSVVSCGDSGGSGSSCQTDSCGYCAVDQVDLKICSFVSTPTISESITLKNYTAASINLNGYTLWDANANGNGSGQKTLTSSDVITAGGTLTFGSLPFVINDSGETIYLKDASAVVIHTRTN